METGKPLISILMAVYEPRLDWLREQLESLEAQTYPNLRLYIRDDCSPTVPLEEINRCVEACIRNFPWTITRNEKNLGSNGTFQRLTEDAEYHEGPPPSCVTIGEGACRRTSDLKLCHWVHDAGASRVCPGGCPFLPLYGS